jgi:hypothetical protein
MTLWSLWLERNSRVFREVSRLPVAIFAQMWEDVQLWIKALFVSASQLAFTAEKLKAETNS